MTMLALLQLSWPRAAMLCLPLLPGGTKRYSMAVWRGDQPMKGPSCCANRKPAAFVEAFPVRANREIVCVIGPKPNRNVARKAVMSGKRGSVRVDIGGSGTTKEQN